MDPKSTELLIAKSQGAVKEAVWVNDMWHHMAQEPGFENVIKKYVDFISRHVVSK